MTAGASVAVVRLEGNPFRGGGRALAASLIAGAAGTVLLVVGLFTDRPQVFFSYLVAYGYLFAVVLGAAAFVMSAHAAGATWPTAVRRLAEAVMALVPLLPVLLVPVLVGAGFLYPWMHPDRIVEPEVRRVLLHRREYLNLPFVVIRAVVYFAFLLLATQPLRRWSRRMDRPGEADELAVLRRRMRALSSLALPGFAIFGTMAAWDWLMSLSPDWYSTMFGLNYLAGGFVAALAVVSLLTVRARRAGYLVEIGPSHYYALGRMMFAFLIFWAYTSYFQYFLSWIANRPIEARWFVERSRGAYGQEGLFLVFGCFGFPFLVLLSYWIKRRAWGVRFVALWIVVSHYFAVHWLVAAARGRTNPFSWLDAAAVLCVGGFAIAFAIARQRGVPLAAVHDPTFGPALKYESI